MPSGYWDIHNHILPGVDDGASCMEETYDLLAEEYRQGVRSIIFTPHHRPKLFRVSIQEREEVYQKVCRSMQPEFPELRFYLGCELYIQEGLEDIQLGGALFLPLAVQHHLPLMEHQQPVPVGEGMPQVVGNHQGGAARLRNDLRG